MTAKFTRTIRTNRAVPTALSDKDKIFLCIGEIERQHQEISELRDLVANLETRVASLEGRQAGTGTDGSTELPKSEAPTADQSDEEIVAKTTKPRRASKPAKYRKLPEVIDASAPAEGLVTADASTEDHEKTAPESETQTSA